MRTSRVLKPLSGSRKRFRTRDFGFARIAATPSTWKSLPPSIAMWGISSARRNGGGGEAKRDRKIVVSLIRKAPEIPMASEEELKAEIERLRAENQSLKK